MSLKELFGKIADDAAQLTAKALGQERISQYANQDPNNGTACFFTYHYMYFRTVYKYSKTWQEYKADCVKIGAMRNDFKILDRDLMARAAGQRLIAKGTTAKLREKIYELLLLDRPVGFALNGGAHFESIDGFVPRGDKLFFTIDDPAAGSKTRSTDIEADAQTLSVYNEAGKISGTITKIYWYEET